MPSTPSSIRRILLVTHGDPQVTGDVVGPLAEALHAAGIDLVLTEDEVTKHPTLAPVSVDAPNDVDLILVLGGDGTMLRGLHRMIGRSVPTLGVNFGTFGFLTTLRRQELLTRLPDVLAGRFEVVDLPTVVVDTPEGSFTAVNDILVTADSLGRMAVLEWEVNGVPLGQRGCDGILVATPAGSTGYNLSAGGPVLGWGVDAIVVTFVAPHTLDGRPLILARGHEVRIVSRTRDVGSRVVVDGHPVATLERGAAVTVRMGPDYARLGQLHGRPFLARYRERFAR